MTDKMKDLLRDNIAETTDGGAWTAITPIYWQDGTPWQLSKLERDIDFMDTTYRCVIVQKFEYYDDDLTAIETSKDIFFDAWEIK